MTQPGGAGADGASLRIADAGPARIFTLNRPARLNAIDVALAVMLHDGLVDAIADPAVRVLILCGADGNFCTGADLKRSAAAARESVLETLQECFQLLHGGPKPCIAAVDGCAYGGGFSLALACDFIDASGAARFCAPFTGIGLIPDAGMIWTLPKRVGMAKARQWMFEGSVIHAGEALASGLIDSVSEEGTALKAAVARAEVLATRSPLAISALRTLLNKGDQPPAQALAEELAVQSRLRHTEDFAEAVLAFSERRPPRFRAC
jgi:2-(1,2-epoxy-1,2-dihydrophenyl)acetyl-CoA isomerase